MRPVRDAPLGLSLPVDESEADLGFLRIVPTHSRDKFGDRFGMRPLDHGHTTSETRRRA